jgi:uncharacterized protein (DUF1697 family)
MLLKTINKNSSITKSDTFFHILLISFPKKLKMQTYISFLRGINMTGNNSIKMADLTVLYKDLGFNNISTYIQSGNVIFSCDDNFLISDVTLKIEKAISEKFNFNIQVLIRTINEIEELISLNPFLSEENFSPSKMAIILLSKKPSDIQIQKVTNIDYPPDKFKIINNEIFIYCPNGFGKSKLYTNFFEKKMSVTGTARNWKTMTTLLDLAKKR